MQEYLFIYLQSYLAIASYWILNCDYMLALQYLYLLLVGIYQLFAYEIANSEAVAKAKYSYIAVYISCSRVILLYQYIRAKTATMECRDHRSGLINRLNFA